MPITALSPLLLAPSTTPSEMASASAARGPGPSSFSRLLDGASPGPRPAESKPPEASGQDGEGRNAGRAPAAQPGIGRPVTPDVKRPATGAAAGGSKAPAAEAKARPATAGDAPAADEAGDKSIQSKTEVEVAAEVAAAVAVEAAAGGGTACLWSPWQIQAVVDATGRGDAGSTDAAAGTMPVMEGDLLSTVDARPGGSAKLRPLPIENPTGSREGWLNASGSSSAPADAALAGAAASLTAERADSTASLAPSAAASDAGAPVPLPAALSALGSATPGTAGVPAQADGSHAALTAHPGSPEFGSQLGDRISSFVRAGVHHAQLQLNPAEMGPLTVQIQLDGQTAQIHLAAENARTRLALEMSMPLLAGSLREAGLTLTGGGVFEQPREPSRDAPGEARDNPRQHADASRDEALQAAAATVRGPWQRHRGVVDLVA